MMNAALRILLVLVLAAGNGFAAIAFDASASGISATGVSTDTYSLTVGSVSNGKLVTCVSYYDSNRHVSTLTYGAQSMTLIARENDGTHAATIELWRLDAPTAGSHTVTVTLDANIVGSATIMSTSFSLSGVAGGANSALMASPYVVTGTHSSQSGTTTTVANNEWIVNCIGVGQAPSGLVANGSQANTLVQNGSATVHSIGTSTLGPISPAAATSTGWTFTSNGNASVMLAASFAPFVSTVTARHIRI